MRPLFITIIWCSCLFSGLLGYSQLIANSRYLHNSNQTLRAISRQLIPQSHARFARLAEEAKRRALIYENQIKKHQLVDGMLVNRSIDGAMHDHCDSLLFSALRYVSLEKLGWHERATDAWLAIEKSRDNGTWLRHPQCFRSTSRDMLLGLLIAMTRSPPGYRQHLNSLMAMVDENNGYFGTGPFYVSYLSPGLTRLMATIALNDDSVKTVIPAFFDSGYSTAEVEVMVTPRGFESHLGGLTAWLELELAEQGKFPKDSTTGMLRILSKLTPQLGLTPIDDQRLDWITDRLVKSDPNNLFFRYLRLRAAGALTESMRSGLLVELLNMPQFPRDRLPMNCDRSADYLWQREDRARNLEPIPCTMQFSGTDFLWMTALLLDDSNAVIAGAH